MKTRTLALMGFTALLSGCVVSNPYSETVEDYVAAESRISLGMSIDEVDRVLAPTQHRLSLSERKRDKRFSKQGQEVLVRYYRSGWQPDGRLTDDEYTPYRFDDGKLTAIGELATTHIVLAL